MCIRWDGSIMPAKGLLILTNDGELANRLMKAASHVAKTMW